MVPGARKNHFFKSLNRRGIYYKNAMSYPPRGEFALQ